jgi:hypothetical protein
MRAEVHDADQHEERADHRVDEELQTRVDAPLAAPDPDDEVHRDEHRLPHHVEEEQVERHEDAEHPGREEEEERVVRARLATDRGEAPVRREQHDEGREEDHHQGDAVESERESDPPRGNPGAVEGLLPAFVAGIERPPEPEREDELEREDGGGEDARAAGGAGRDFVLPFLSAASGEHDEQGADQRQRQERRENPGVVADGQQEIVHRVSGS